MEKKHNSLIIGVLAILSLISISYLLNPNGFLSATGGSTSTSIDTITVQSDNPKLSGEVIQIITEADNSARYTEGTLTPEQASNYGVSLASTFTIKQNVNYSKCQFQIQDNAFAVKDWVVREKSNYKNNPCKPAPLGSTCSCGSYSGYVVQQGVITNSEYRYLGCSDTCSCPAYKTTNIGSLHYINSQAEYDYGLETTLSVGGKDYTVFNTKENKESSIEDMYVRLLSSGTGDITCPTPASSYMAWRPANTNTYELKRDDYTGVVIGKCSIINNYQDVAVCQQAIANMKASTTSNEFYYCDSPTFEGTLTKMWCEPSTPPVIPRSEILIKADKIGVVIPVGEPEIVSVGTQTCEASSNCYLNATIRNKGTDADSFDIALEGVKGFAIREQLNAGEQKTIQIQYSLAGVIQKFNLVMTSVNDPTRKDIEEVSVEVYPFCDKNPPSANHVRVFTEYGCVWKCKDEVLYNNDIMGWGKNIFESDCTEIPDYPIESEQQEALEIERQSEKHCINEGKYAWIGRYTEDQLSFIPAYKEHQVWLGAPFCKYVMEYGWKMENGVPVKITDDYVFFERSVPEGQEVVNNVGEQATDTTEGGTLIPTETSTGETSPLIYIAGAILLGLITLAGYIFLVKKKRKR